MKQKKTPLLVPVLWFITTGLWTVTFCRNFFYHGRPDGLTLLQGLVVLVSLAAAIVNLIRYRKTRGPQEGS